MPLVHTIKTSIRTTWVVIFLAESSSVLASGVAPYLPINSSPALDNEIERLVAISNIPSLTKPYNLATIYHYLDKISETHPNLYKRIDRALASYEKTFGLTYKKIGLSTNAKNEKGEHLKPNANGVTTEQHYQSIVRGQWQIHDHFGLYLGANITDDENELSGSSISLGTSSAQLDIGFKEHWFGPLNGSSNLISNNAQTMPSITLSNNLPMIAYNTAINYELFLAQMSVQPVEYNGEISDKKKPYLSGLHLSIQPLKFWTIGANRTYQFSGGERPFSLTEAIHAFTEPDQAIMNDSNTEEASGELLESLSSRLNIQTIIPFSLKFEYATKNNHAVTSTSSKKATSAGIYFPYLLKDMFSLNYEYVKWQDGWYKNISSPYQLGYSNEGQVIGNWALTHLENTTLTENQGAGTSHYVSLVTQFKNNHILTTTIRRTENENSAEINIEDTWQIQLNYTIPYQVKALSIELHTGSDQIGETYSQLGVSLQW